MGVLATEVWDTHRIVLNFEDLNVNVKVAPSTGLVLYRTEFSC